MLEADTPRGNVSFWSPARKAWAIITIAFLVFCAGAGAGTRAVMTIVRTPVRPALRVLVQQPESVLIRPAGLLQANPAGQDDALNVGDTLITAEKAYPGVVGVVKLAPGTISLWANTQLNVQQRRGTSVPTKLKLHRGQVMIVLPTAGEPLEVETNDGTIKLAAPGHYRLRRLALDAPTTAVAEQDSAPDNEVVVAAGEATVGDLHVQPGARLLLRKAKRGFFPNAWPLLRDGKFREFSEEAYNRTMVDDPLLTRANTWQVTVQNPVSPGPNAHTGHFEIESLCPQPGNYSAGCREAAHFVRKGGNDQPSITAITQQVRADVIAYQSLMLSAALQIRSQSLSKTGVLGTECPILIRVYYVNTQNSEQHEFDYCFWALEVAGQKSTESSYPWIKTIHIEPENWYNFSVDLKQQLPDLLMIQKIEIHSNGHDYDTLVADVGLNGIDLTTRLPSPRVRPVATVTPAAEGVRWDMPGWTDNGSSVMARFTSVRKPNR
ncbi:MAG: hypothetical protein NVS4B8_13460 [Herpetosiphon sp.]